MDRPLSLRQLRRALMTFGVLEDPSRGKGSHTTFYKLIDGHKVSFPVPTSKDTLPTAYAKAARRKFKLLPEDGVTDKQFYDAT